MGTCLALSLFSRVCWWGFISSRGGGWGRPTHLEKASGMWVDVCEAVCLSECVLCVMSMCVCVCLWAHLGVCVGVGMHVGLWFLTECACISGVHE